MSIKLIVFLVVGTIAMGIPLLIMAKHYSVSKWKILMLTVLLTVTGTIGTFLMYYVENQYFGGLSFYGAVFLVPFIFLVVAPILRIPYSKAMDFCAVGECIMLALMKIHCIMGACCLGRVLCKMPDGAEIRFPSRIVEMIVAVIIFVVLFRWSRKGKNLGALYPWYILLYGTTRFGLNILREAWVEKEMLLPFGNIWSLVAVVSGIIWLIIIYKKNSELTYKDDIE